MEFRQGDKILDVTDINVQFNFNNSGLDESLIKGSHSTGSTAPVTPANDLFFNLCRHIEVKDKKRLYPDVTFYFKGNAFLFGNIVLRRISSKGYTFSFDVCGFAGEIFGINLRDIPYDDIPMGSSQDQVLAFAKDASQKFWPETPVSFPVLINTAFYGDANPDAGTYINRYYSGAYEKNTTTNYNKNSLVPQFYLMWLLEKIFAYIGYSWKGSFFTHPDFKKLCFYNNFALDSGSGQKRFAKAEYTTVKYFTDFNWWYIPMTSTSDVDGAYTNALFGYQAFVNSRYTCRAELQVTNPFNHLIKAQIVAYSYTSNTVEILDELEIRNETAILEGVYVSNPNDLNVHIRVRVMTYHLANALVTSNLSVTDEKSSNLNILAKTISPKNHVPDMTIGEALSAVRSISNIKFDMDFTKKEISLDYAADTLKKQPFDLTPYAIDNPQIELQEQKGYEFNFNFEEDELAEGNFIPQGPISFSGAILSWLPPANEHLGKFAYLYCNNSIYKSMFIPSLNIVAWRKQTDAHFPIKIGNGSIKIEPKWAPMLMYYRPMVILCPQIEGKGTSNLFATGENKFPLRFFYYYGFQAVGAGDIPFASSQNYSFNGTKLGDTPLTWDYLYNTFYKPWINALINAEEISQDFDLPEILINNDLFNRTVTVNYSEFILKNIKLLLKNDKVEFARAEMLKINP
jgi:hypothetical protein